MTYLDVKRWCYHMERAVTGIRQLFGDVRC
jgi:hypothetical protein